MHQVGGGGEGNNGVSGDEVCAKDDAANGERECYSAEEPPNGKIDDRRK